MGLFLSEKDFNYLHHLSVVTQLQMKYIFVSSKQFIMYMASSLALIWKSVLLDIEIAPGALFDTNISS